MSGEDLVSADVQRSLDDLRAEWGDPYHIFFSIPRGKFAAIPRRGPISDPLEADTDTGLLALIRADYEKENRSGPTDLA